MFGIDNPARDVLELVEWLTDSSHNNHQFRGQTHFFATGNCPSNLRKFSEGGDGIWTSLNPSPKGIKPQQRAKSDLAQAILLLWGKTVGNLICQQYGITSDAFDVTSNINIAAFFATHSYPYYEQYVPSDSNNDIGIIYRIDSSGTENRKIENFESNSRTLHLESRGRKFIFNDVKNLRPLYFRKKIGKEGDLDRFLESQFPAGHMPRHLHRPAAYLCSKDIESIFIPFIPYNHVNSSRVNRLAA